MIKQAYLVLTEQCNLTCSHCIRESSPYRNEISEETMLISAIEQIHQSFPHILISLTGGEPTIYQGFERLLNKCLILDVNISINSNGTTSFFHPKKLEKWQGREKLSIQISLDGVEYQHDLIRGGGSYKKALIAIKRLKNAGIRCCVSSTVISMNFFDKINEFLNNIDYLDLEYIAIKRATYAGRASSGMEIDSKSWNDKVYEIRKIHTQTEVRINPMFDFSHLDKLDSSVISEIETPASVNCGAGTEKFYIYPNGNLCGCTCFKEHPMGNLYKRTIDEILNVQQVIKVENPTCIKCRYWHLCKGGCLGSGYQHSGILGTPDPRCEKI